MFKRILNVIMRFRFILFLSLLFLAIVFFYLSIYYNDIHQSFYTSLYISLFVAFIQIIITVFIIEKVLERYQEREWNEALKILEEIIENEIKNGLIDVIYAADFSEYGEPHCYLNNRLEENTHLEINEAIYAGEKLIKELKLDDFPDHYKNKKGEDKIKFHLFCIEGFPKRMQQNLESLDRIIQFYQVKMPSGLFSHIIKCRTEYNNLIKHIKGYQQFLSVSEKTGSLIEWNLKFEMKHKKEMYNSIIKIIEIMIEILNNKKFLFLRHNQQINTTTFSTQPN